MKFFAVSDIHGFYDELRDALNQAGFEENNPTHLLVVCGDVTDRGPEPFETIQYLQNLSNAVVIKGNHCSLLEECIDRREFFNHDLSNGTADTIMDLADSMFGHNKSRPFAVACELIEDKVKEFINSMVDYYETKNYVFVHGWLPINQENNLSLSKMEDWRNATHEQWEDARWLNSMQMVHNGFSIEKTVVAGHWHSSWGRAHFDGEQEWGYFASFAPYYMGKELIAIDGCVSYSGIVNVLVLEDELLNTTE